MRWRALSLLGCLRKKMRKQWKYFLLAVGFFTRIPIPSDADFEANDLNHAAKYFPLVGIIVGIFGAISFVLSSLILPHNLAVLISMAVTIYMTGAFHEDGLADSVDGLGGGWHKEQILTIMQDSRLGTYGAVALFLMLFAKFQILNSLNAYVVPMAIFAAHALSRLSAIWVMATLSYTKLEGKAKPLATKITGLDLLVAHVFGLLPYVGIVILLIVSHHSPTLIMQFLLMTLIPVIVSWFWWRHKIRRWLSGYTGDTLGAMQQLTELAFYLGVLVWSYQV
jgi:adenosylcobinamide-GDP ribazoletransferase